MWCVAEQDVAFLQTVAHLTKLGKIEVFKGLFEVSYPAVHQFGAFGRGFGGKVILIDQRYPEPPERGI